MYLQSVRQTTISPHEYIKNVVLTMDINLGQLLRILLEEKINFGEYYQTNFKLARIFFLYLLLKALD